MLFQYCPLSAPEALQARVFVFPAFARLRRRSHHTAPAEHRRNPCARQSSMEKDMTNHDRALSKHSEPELVTLAKACRRIGISPATALKLSDFPKTVTLGARRMIARRAVERWLAEKTLSA
jgi:hypothetical protein